MMWKEKYALGVTIIDGQHKEIFNRVESFVIALRTQAPWEERVEKVNELMDFMKDYVVEHFQYEEAYQKTISFPGYEAHKEKHECMMAYIREISKEYESSGCNELFMQQFAGKLLSWLINHVATEDQEIGIYSGSQNFYRSLFEAFGAVFKIMLDISDIVECPQVDFTNTEILCISIGITGNYEGRIIYHFPIKTALNMAAILCGIEINCVDDFVISVVSEFASIISGNVLTMLADDYIHCKTMPPESKIKKNITKNTILENDIEYKVDKTCGIRTSIGDACFYVRLNSSK